MAVGDNLTVAWTTAVVLLQAFEDEDWHALEKGMRELREDFETAEVA
jgi:hypothetical protein